MGKKNPIISTSKIFKVDYTNIKFRDIAKLITLEMNPICTKIFNTKDDEKIFLINYFFIRFVTVIETFCRNAVISIIDQQNIDVAPLFQKGESTIPIDSIDEIKKKEFTKGRVVATNFSFQNPKDINFVFSHLLNIDFFDTIRDFKNLEDIKNDVDSKDLTGFIENWDNFLEIFEIRNQIVHSLKPIDYQKYDNDYFEDWYVYLSAFLYIIHVTIKWILFIRNGESPNKQELHIFNFYKNKLK